MPLKKGNLVNGVLLTTKLKGILFEFLVGDNIDKSYPCVGKG